MTVKEVNQLIESIGPPSVYYQFPEGTEQKTPFICWYFPNSADVIADNTIYKKKNSLVIELYTDYKDFQLESEVEAALTAAGFVFSWDETELDTERMHMTTYYTEVFIDG